MSAAGHREVTRLAALYCGEPVPDQVPLSAAEAAAEAQRLAAENADLPSLGGGAV